MEVLQVTCMEVCDLYGGVTGDLYGGVTGDLYGGVCYRCGMVYLDPEELKWLPYVKTWINGYKDKLRQDTFDFFLELFTRYVEEGLKFVSKKCEQAIYQVGVWRERERERQTDRQTDRQIEKIQTNKN